MTRSDSALGGEPRPRPRQPHPLEEVRTRAAGPARRNALSSRGKQTARTSLFILFRSSRWGLSIAGERWSRVSRRCTYRCPSSDHAPDDRQGAADDEDRSCDGIDQLVRPVILHQSQMSGLPVGPAPVLGSDHPKMPTVAMSATVAIASAKRRIRPTSYACSAAQPVPARPKPHATTPGAAYAWSGSGVDPQHQSDRGGHPPRRSRLEQDPSPALRESNLAI